jgi:hypothetical protein
VPCLARPGKQLQRNQKHRQHARKV